jgi:hypothetical protein
MLIISMKKQVDAFKTAQMVTMVVVVIMEDVTMEDTDAVLLVTDADLKADVDQSVTDVDLKVDVDLLVTDVDLKVDVDLLATDVDLKADVDLLATDVDLKVLLLMVVVLLVDAMSVVNSHVTNIQKKFIKKRKKKKSTMIHVILFANLVINQFVINLVKKYVNAIFVPDHIKKSISIRSIGHNTNYNKHYYKFLL